MLDCSADITPGANWAESIADAIPMCKIMLLIFSSSANMSPQVLREVELAVKHKLIIVPVKIEDVNPTKGMEYYLSTVHWIDVVNKKTKKYISELTHTVKGFLGCGASEPQMPIAGLSAITKSKRIPPVVWISAAALVVVLAVLGVIFRDNIFGQNTKPDDLNQTQPTEEISAGEQPTASAEPKSELLQKVDIKDETLKECIIKTLELQGVTVGDDLTIEDMHKLEYLKVASQKEYEEGLLLMADANEELHSLITNNFIVTEDNIESLDGIEYATNLKHLCIVGKSIRDIKPLESLTNIEILFLTNNKISDIESLKYLTNVRRIEINNNLIIDISPLENLTTLQQLYLSSNLIENIEPLKNLTNLEGLGISDNQITDISFISDLRYLDGINISSNKIKDISVLSYMRKATWLVMQDNEITDISSLASLEELAFLGMEDNDIDDLAPLGNLENLKYIGINFYTYDKNTEIIQSLQGKGMSVSVDGEKIE